MKIGKIRAWGGLAVPLLIGLGSIYFMVRYNTTLSPRELIMIQAAQFISSLWFGWSVSYLFSAASFHEQQRKFAISAYRRINEIDYAVERLLRRTQPESTSRKVTAADLGTIRELALSLRYTVTSSKADWGDIIGEEIKIAESIKQPDKEENKSDAALSERVEKLLSLLPAPLEIQARRAVEDVIPYYVEQLKHELDSNKHITVQGFWTEGCARNITDFKIGDTLYLSIDDLGDRVGALIAHDVDGKTVGVMLNESAELDYHEFVEALSRAIGASKFTATLVGVEDQEAKETSGDQGERRRYFNVDLSPQA